MKDTKKRGNRKKKNLIWQAIVTILSAIVVSVTVIQIANVDVESANIKFIESEPRKVAVISAKLATKVETETKVMAESKTETKTKLETETEMETETELETETESETESEIETEEQMNMEYMGQFMVTAYCACTACCGYNAQGLTAMGTYVQEGYTVAVDPDVIPLGSQIYMNGNVYSAEDTGAGIYGNTIDLYMDSHEEALNWGVQYLDVYLLN